MFLTDEMKRQYECWMSSGDKTYTEGGNLRAPSKEQLVRWVLASWSKLPEYTLIRSFKVCGLTTSLDGSENNEIKCLRGDQQAQDLLQSSGPVVHSVEDEEGISVNEDSDVDIEIID
jgi:hypothetical protein